MRGALLAGALVLAAPALAQEGPAPRCAVLGQMAVSAWLDLLGELPGRDPERIEPAADRLARDAGTYDRLGCPPAPLEAAFDCLLEGAEGATGPRDRARLCLREAGLARG